MGWWCCGLAPSHKIKTRSAKIPTLLARIRSGTRWWKMMPSSASRMLRKVRPPPSARNNECSAASGLVDGG
jgi:hypothetical protein